MPSPRPETKPPTREEFDTALVIMDSWDESVVDPRCLETATAYADALEAERDALRDKLDREIRSSEARTIQVIDLRKERSQWEAKYLMAEEALWLNNLVNDQQSESPNQAYQDQCREFANAKRARLAELGCE